MGKKDDRQEVEYDYRTANGRTGHGSVEGTKAEVTQQLLDLTKGEDIEVLPPRKK